MTGDDLDLDQLLAVALDAADAGGAIVRDAFGRVHETPREGPGRLGQRHRRRQRAGRCARR